MKKAYYVDITLVIAENMAEAEKAYLKEHGQTATIRSITLESEYVLVAEVEK